MTSAATVFKVHSHACMSVRHGDDGVIVDPWLTGTCYWKSWANFPNPEYADEDLAGCSHVVISHIHWDHWHGLTLKKLLRDRKVIVHRDPNRRSVEDLAAIGMRDVTELDHGRSITLGAIRITIYQFGLFMNDSAIVIETPDVRILNANDAKIAGLALKHIVRRHGPFDFALRSHSSANYRASFEVPDDVAPADDRGHYANSFHLFMEAVRPRWAVPFASNHCYVHPDVRRFNGYAVGPWEVEEHVRGRHKHYDLVVMAPGARWSSRDGFELPPPPTRETAPALIRSVVERHTPGIERYLARERRVRLTDRVYDTFRDLLEGIPGALLARPLRQPAAFTVFWPDGETVRFAVARVRGRIEIVRDHAGEARVEIFAPAIVFRDATMLNMWSHALISKRLRIVCRDARARRDAETLLNLLAFVEMRVLPLTASGALHFGRQYVRRWREAAVYLLAAWLKLSRRLPLYRVEEEILRRSRPSHSG